MGRICVGLMLGFNLSACSVALDWDPADGLPCDGRLCDPGFSCRGRTCIADRTLAEGDSCTEGVQCETGLVCSRSPSLVCAKPCSTYFTSTSNCAAGTYCRPYLDLDDQWFGSCIETDGCEVDEDCPSSTICVRMSSSASACLVGCEVTFTPTYDDGCGSGSSGKPLYCTPVGAANSQRPICLETNAVAQQQGAQCDPVNNPCAQGHACYQQVPGSGGTCLRYCDFASQGSQCPPGTICVGKELGGGNVIDVCESNTL